MHKPLNVHIVQTDTVWESPAANFAQIEELLRKAPPPENSIIVLPEMFSTGFTMAPERVASSMDAEVTEWMSSLGKHHNAHVIGSFVEAAEGRYYNTAFLAAPDGAPIGSYRKIHLFEKERFHYFPGGRLFTFPIGGFVGAVFICYDLRFPELFRLALDRGVNLFFIPANWPSARRTHWDLLLQARALENQAFVCACNRTGSDPSLAYDGGSCLVQPNGVMALQLNSTPQVASAPISPSDLLALRGTIPWAADRRTDVYASIANNA